MPRGGRPRGGWGKPKVSTTPPPGMKLSANILLILLLVVACAEETPVEQAEEEAGVEEVASEPTTNEQSHPPPPGDQSDPETWRATIDYDLCERLIQYRGPMAKERFELANAPEREKLCRQVFGLPNKEVEEEAIATARAHPEKDWSKGYTPMPDGSIIPTVEAEQMVEEAVEQAKEKMDSAK